MVLGGVPVGPAPAKIKKLLIMIPKGPRTQIIGSRDYIGKNVDYKRIQGPK